MRIAGESGCGSVLEIGSGSSARWSGVRGLDLELGGDTVDGRCDLWISVRVSDGVMVALAIILSVVGSIRAVPRRCVVSAREDAVVTVFVEDIGNEELADIRVLHRRKTVLDIVGTFGVTCGGAN